MIDNELIVAAVMAEEVLDNFRTYLRDYHDLVVSSIGSGEGYVLSGELTALLNPDAYDIRVINSSINKIVEYTGIGFSVGTIYA